MNARDGVDGDGATRARERDALLANRGWQSAPHERDLFTDSRAGTGGGACPPWRRPQDQGVRWSGQDFKLNLVADRFGARRGIYLAFNRDIAAAAARKFPPHVPARTMHAQVWAEADSALKRRSSLEADPWANAGASGCRGWFCRLKK